MLSTCRTWEIQHALTVGSGSMTVNGCQINIDTIYQYTEPIIPFVDEELGDWRANMGWRI
jgi:hypothetical protein